MELRLLHQLLRMKCEVQVHHISRNQNEVADHMVKYATIETFVLQMFEIPPISLKDLLIDDCHGPRPVLL